MLSATRHLISAEWDGWRTVQLVAFNLAQTLQQNLSLDQWERSNAAAFNLARSTPREPFSRPIGAQYSAAWSQPTGSEKIENLCEVLMHQLCSIYHPVRS